MIKARKKKQPVRPRGSQRPQLGSRQWRVQVLVRKRRRGLAAAWVRRMAAQILDELADEGLPASVNELSVVFIGDRAMRVLNRDFRGKDKPTDVLSFAQLEGENSFPSPTLGDLVISVDTTARQAREYGVSYRQELLRLMIHGILHLHGYDHEGVSKAEAQRMRRREERIFQRLSAA